MWKWIKKLLEKKEDEILVSRLVSRYSNVTVAKILELAKHPNADRLQLVKVDAGKYGQLDIVCGANNIAVGQKVPLALVGCRLTNGMEIKTSVIRGEKSAGMLCAADELGLGEDHSGIVLLDSQAVIGEEIDEYLPK
ncbi:hypothetical protein COT94_02185 [Candidatus Falkowbacteria bacterium CG10_big_fil_rev_8_21_14_0_10_37_14]|uniref:tRNA-binding domain-containing protein n=1 Tax=Candidatus Falkowbacteria bacterium CG10_big_fil_rev_8_21_14_0_10_37_14 TaxID=1974561 RepID=A0A2M6WTD5_9BACT|nr:hypothetical protein [Candidatus Falkowbacteria bacterium]PIT96050.1 MAG: hypothetical protein COT94_02185 [Candidatus Falkowbacteria bacterium CG10_big_fil_rev_8_21_14_0_10_37_14]